jgi:periplasmic protein TonB
MTPSGIPMPSWEAPPAPVAHAPALSVPAPKKRSAAIPIVFVLLLVGGIAGGYFYLRSRPLPALTTASEPNPGATMAPVAAPSASPLTPAETGTLTPIPTQTTDTNPPAAGTVAPTLDPALVDQEVQRLLTAERARLEQQQAAAATQRAQQQPAPTVRPPAPQPQATPTQTVAPAAAQEPEPVPAEPTATQAAETRPAPTETATPAAPRFRQGDLVPQGTEGLTPARVIRYGTVPYPPMARAQRVEGTIIMNVLVSESGQVLEVRLIRGVPRPVGLNEAAEQVIRRSTFSAPLMRDGTRVKSWATVPVKFEL